MLRFLFFLIFFGSLFGEIPYYRDGTNHIGHIKLEMDRPIDQSTYLYVKFALEHFRKIKSPFVILELNTPGGEVFAAQKIAHLLHESDSLHHMPVVAYINHWAISAGAMLAYSCKMIAISPSASMGAAEPVMMQGGSMESASEKINSALRAEFANFASLYGRNPLLAEAMVDKEIILVRRSGKIIKLDRENDFKAGEDEIISAKDKLLTLNASQLVEYGVADVKVPAQNGDENPIFQTEAFRHIPNPKLVAFSNWKVHFFTFLTHPVIASILMIGLMLGFYLEIQSGGFGLPACLGLTCLGLILLSQFAASAIQWLEMILIVVGLGLLALELFIFPTFGIGGILGIFLFLGGLFALGQPEIRQVKFSFQLENWNLAAHSFINGLGWFCGSLLVSFVAVIGMSRWTLPRYKSMDLKEEEPVVSPLIKIKPGTLGIVFTPCRPAGQIEIDGHIYSAFSQWGFIDKGEKIIIDSIDLDRIIIRPLVR